MADKSAIEWTDATWNPIVGCSIVSPGCTNCYAMKMAARIERMGGAPHYDDMTQGSKAGPVWTGKVAIAPDHILTAPLRWKRPRRIFVNSMGDLFHESIPEEWIDKVFAVMALSPQHTFQVLTKRAKRMREYCSNPTTTARIFMAGDLLAFDRRAAGPFKAFDAAGGIVQWPLPNVWLGVSAERQQEADERIPLLRDTTAAVRFISFEPLLSHIEVDLRGIHWAIAGGESGHGARPMHPVWPRRLRNLCAEQGVPFFFKQWGSHRPVSSLCDGVSVRDSDDMVKVDKKSAGRLLDGKEHNGFPQAKEKPFA